MQMFLHYRKRIVGAPSTPEPKRSRIEVRFEDGLQNEFQSHLHQSIFQRWDAKRAESSRLAGLRD